MCVCLKLCFISSLAFFDCKEDGIFPKPPSYNVATTLPSYDEAERTKAETNVPLVPGRVSVSLFFFSACGHIQYIRSLTHIHSYTDACAWTLPVLSARHEVLSLSCGIFLVFFMYATVSFLLVFVTGLNKCRFKNEEKHFLLFISKDICWYLCTQCPQLAAV